MSMNKRLILSVCESPGTREYIDVLMAQAGIGDVQHIKNMVETVRRIKYQKPNLVLLDHKLKQIDLISLCRKIRSVVGITKTPLIVLAESCTAQQMEQLFEAGINDILRPTCGYAELTAQILFHMEYNRQMNRLELFKENTQKDLNIAKTIQSKSLISHDIWSKTLAEKNYLFSGFYQPSYTIGGDYFNIFSLSTQEPLFVIYDVIGKGINAAINSSYINSMIEITFKNFQSRPFPEFSPERFLRELNVLLCRNLHHSVFCACAIFAFDPESAKVKYAGCAMPPARMRKNGHISMIELSGLPLAVSEKNFNPARGEFEIEPGALFFASTDGLIEAKRYGDEKKEGEKESYFLPGELALDDILLSIDICPGAGNEIIDNFEENGFNILSDDVTFFVLGRPEKNQRIRP